MKVLTCPCCNNSFVDNMYSIYNIKYKHRLYKFCSYTCYRNIQKLYEDKDYEKIDEILMKSKT